MRSGLLSTFSAKTLHTLDTRENNITLMRLLAAWLVLYSHSFVLVGARSLGDFSWPDRVSAMIMPFHMKLSGVAVAMFFVLSGFLITKSFVRRKSLPHYVVSRALRIYPALWVNLLFCMLIVGPLLTPFSLGEILSSERAWNFLKINAVMLKTNFRLMGPAEIFPGNPNPFGINGSLWTLPAELRAYALVFLLGLIGAFRSKVFFAVALVGLIALYLYTGDGAFLIAHASHTRLMLFFLIGAGFYMVKDWIPVSVLGLALMVGISALAWKTQAYTVISSITLGYAFIVLAYHPALRLPSIDRFGDLSYGLYLYAFPVQQGVIALWPSLGAYGVVMVATALTLPLAAASWFGVERPALSRKDSIATPLARLIPGYNETRKTPEKPASEPLSQTDKSW